MSGQGKAWVEIQGERRPHAEAVVWNGSSIDWRELRLRAQVAARRLDHALGTGPRVAVLLATPSLRFLELLHAAQIAGVTLAPMSTRGTEGDWTRVVSAAEPGLVLHDAAFADAAASLARRGGCRAIEVESEFECTPAAVRPPDPVVPDRTWLLVHTSGTTGLPKEVRLRNGQLEAAATAVLSRLECRPGERWLAAMPMHHVGGLSVPVRAAVGGLCVVLHPAFDAEAVHRSLERESIAWVSLVPTMLSSLLDVAPATPAPAALRGAILGGGRLPARLVERASRLAWPVVATYGMTETAAQVTTSLRGDAAAHPGSAGHPLRGVELRIESPDSVGVGEILVRGPQVCRNLRDGAEADAGPPGEDWLHTGDLGRLDDAGRLWVETRRSDLIVSGGENVRPEEVEDLLLEHASIVEAGVFPVDDDHWGQVVAAAIVVTDDAPTDEELAAWCSARIARFKVPRRWLRLERLPRNASGKLERLRLRRLAAEADGGIRPPAAC